MANHNVIGAGRARHSLRAVAPAGRFFAFTAGRGLPALPANAALLGLVGPDAIFGILRYRRVVSDPCLVAALAVIALLALCA
jgi:hypothetical protein